MGLNYGINNKFGKIPEFETFNILLEAHKSGITLLDTAEVYGNAHQLIGEFHKNYPYNKFQIITKLPNGIKADDVNDKIENYLKILNVEKLDILLFHSFDSYITNFDAIEKLYAFKCNGLINQIGVSVYTNEQLEYLVDDTQLDVIQLPFNLLDNKSIRGELISKLKKAGKIIHTRSAFLQGLFFKNINENNNVVKGLKIELSLLNELASKSKCSLVDLALNYCLQQSEIDRVIIGIDSMKQLRENLVAASNIIETEVIEIINQIKVTNIGLLNPSLWNSKQF